MSPLTEIRPATPDEIDLLRERRSRVNKGGGQRPENAAILQQVQSQLAQFGTVTLVFDENDWPLAVGKSNIIRSALHKAGIDIDTSISNKNEEKTKLIISLRQEG